MIAVLDYGIGNLGSAYKALRAIGAQSVLCNARPDLAEVSGVVLPGVGSFGACITALREHGLDKTVFDAIDAQIPVLGICVGMQMFYDGSDESPGVEGLGLVEGWISRISGAKKLPHMGWSRIEFVSPRAPSPLFDELIPEPWFYFVHSFAPSITNDSVAACNYGNGFSAAFAKGALMGTQFHPEKSSLAGLKVMSNFVKLCDASAGT